MSVVTLQTIERTERLLEDALNYVQQAQIILAKSERHGAALLHSMGSRLERKLEKEIESWAP